MSLAQKHRDRVLAMQAASAPAIGGGLTPSTPSRPMPVNSAAAQIRLRFVHDLRRLLREIEERAPEPRAAIFDGRTLQSSPESGARAGYDGYKRRKGSKVHLAVDTLGHLLALKVTPANEQDRAQLGLSILHEQQVPEDAAFEQLVSRLSGDKRATVDKLPEPTPLHLAMIRAIAHAASSEVRSGRIPAAEVEPAMLSTALAAVSPL